ncbi:ATP-binding cassette domain-containing protein [Microbacterium murale]|uniref:ABC-type multidrug transport system ATPase subunit n=1 Tax=Microbacterium murale TaxID=1081040 RepID=A0ABU0P627_9MICO|nr:ABC transporter ATP-binding protein [Microbacterium murale]MDQ0642161.1 ABC-type multidrug transport system ATPase subunit [Microbacterium murale]
MTASPDDPSDRPDDVTDASVDGSTKRPTAKKAAAKPKTATAKSVADKAAAVKSGEAKTAAAKSAAARTTAAKAAAAKSAASRAAATKTAAKTASAKTAAAKAAAAKAAAAKAAATRAATAKAAAADAEAEKLRAAVDESAPAGQASMAGPDEAAGRTASGTPTTKRTTKKTTQAKPRTTKPRTAKPSARPKPVVAADAAAPTSEAVSSPTGEAAPRAVDAVTEDDLFADLLDPADTEPVTAHAHVENVVDPVAPDSVATDPVASEQADPEQAMPEQADPGSADLDSLGVQEPGAAGLAIEDVAAPAPDAGAVSASADVPHAVVLRDLIKDFGDQRAVNGIDLTVPAGSFYGIVGPNGAGKTTTLSILAGLLRPTSGQVVVCGIDLAEDALGAKRVMGVLPDRLRTFDRLTGRQLLHYYGLLRGLAPEVIEKRTADLARAFDLADALNRVVSDYSAGMTKKIMLAGAMIHSPRVLVLDEPFEAVDPVSSAVILDILRAYVAHGGTVILSSHGMDLVERVCSRVAIIVGGDVLAEGTIDEVRAGQTLEARFVELSGGIGEVEGLEWLHTFSD